MVGTTAVFLLTGLIVCTIHSSGVVLLLELQWLCCVLMLMLCCFIRFIELGMYVVDNTYCFDFIVFTNHSCGVVLVLELDVLRVDNINKCLMVRF